MKIRNLLSLSIALVLAQSALAQKGTLRFGEPPETRAPRWTQPPPPVWEDPYYRNPFTNPPPQSAGQIYVYDQKPLGGRPGLVTSEQAQTIIDRFKGAYPALGSPRLLIYVNRELVDERPGMKLTRSEERVDRSRTSGGSNADSMVSTSTQNTYVTDQKTPLTLADRQTVRDVERLFGRPFRSAGASLADQRVATQLIADRPLDEFIGTADTPQARRDREALGKVADAVIEVLISSRSISVPMISGDQTISVPDIQATAISLKDSKILGQASSSDVTTRVPPSALAGFDVREITEATALALMEDMTPFE